MMKKKSPSGAGLSALKYHLDDRTVDIADQLFPVFVDGQHFFVNFRNPGQLFMGNYLEFKPFQVFQRLGNRVGKERQINKTDKM